MNQKKIGKVKVDLIVIGNPNSGKTSLIRRFIQGQNTFTQFYTPTLGLSLQKKVINLDGNEVTVCIWDTAGQQKFFSLTKNYFKKADGVLIVFDLTDKISFDSKLGLIVGIDKFWIPQIKQKSQEDCPQILIGNKRDMINQRIVTVQTAKQMAENIGIKYFETSAKTGQSVNESIEYLVRQCIKKINEQQQSGGGMGLQRPPEGPTGCMGSFKDFFKDIKNKFK